MVTGKQKFALWLTPEAKEQVEANYRADNCKSQSEFIEKAIRFYTGYLNAQNAVAYMPRVLADVLDGVLSVFGDRMGKLLFKQAVEQNIINNIIAWESSIDQRAYEQVRGRSVREVRETNGAISFKDALLFQKGAG